VITKKTKCAWPTRDRTRGRVLEDDIRGLKAKLKQEETTVETLERIGRVLANSEPGHSALGEIAEIVRQLTKTDAAQFLMLQPDGETLLLEADTFEPEKVGRVSIKVGQGLTGWAAKHRRPVAIRRHPWEDPRFLDYPGLEERTFQSLLCVPLISRGERAGNMDTRRARPTSSHELRSLLPVQYINNPARRFSKAERNSTEQSPK
jgi:signal transduction protein with GAF and PtsI domain